jgi:hypothetical protein
MMLTSAKLTLMKFQNFSEYIYHDKLFQLVTNAVYATDWVLRLPKTNLS